MFESMQHYNEPKRDDLGYVLGWFCGGILILGAIVSAVNFFQHHHRKAFQAIVLPLGPIAWLVLFMSGLYPMLGRNPGEVIEAAFLFALVGGIVALPFIELRFLKSLAWPTHDPGVDQTAPRMA